MAHISENSKRLIIKKKFLKSKIDLSKKMDGLSDVCIIKLPSIKASTNRNAPIIDIGHTVAEAAEKLGDNSTLVVIGEVIDLVQVQSCMSAALRYQLWIVVKRTKPQSISDKRQLPNQHFGALVFTRYKTSLRHTKTELEYTYCPACNKTTKDYGGKKHIYHEFGTLLSDVWRDISCELDGNINPLISRFADLFGLEHYKEMVVLDCSKCDLPRETRTLKKNDYKENHLSAEMENSIISGDCIEELRKIPSNSIDFAFADPPYNVKKKYLGYSDDLSIQDYFKWCDEWISELARVLKPGRTLALLNIPLWSIRHFIFMQTIMGFQSWIVWDALAFPVRKIMPAHYSIICFTKGKSRELPGLSGKSEFIKISTAPKTFNALSVLADNYCLREKCVNSRIAKGMNDHTMLTDMWSDIHRLKHNSRRVDHPCQLPRHLMYRLITIFSEPNEVVLDCFNGAGTTTLAAHQLGRKYIGIDASDKYCQLAKERHLEIENGVDPFRKARIIPASKNSVVRRLSRLPYKVSKKTLQLEVREVAQQIGHIPKRDELARFGKYPIEYYDQYFVNWGEVTAAARTTGMTEERTDNKQPLNRQLTLFDKGSRSAKAK